MIDRYGGRGGGSVTALKRINVGQLASSRGRSNVLRKLVGFLCLGKTTAAIKTVKCEVRSDIKVFLTTKQYSAAVIHRETFTVY